MIIFKKNCILIFINIKNISYIRFRNNPKISIFLPIYNKEIYVKQSIESLQNQTLKDIEIVCVNDASTDNTLKKLKQLSKKDKRIKVINNDRNHGLLYSRAMGVINSSGEYLMNLDPDDKLVSSNNLQSLYKTMKSKDLDLIVYKIKRIPLNKTEEILYKYMDDIQFNVTDDHITNKIVKKSLYLKAYNEFKNEIFSNKWNFHEDNIWCILIKKFSKSNALLNEFIYSYKRNGESLNMQKGNMNDLKSIIYRQKKINKLNNINNKFFYTFSVMINLYHSLKDFEVRHNIVKIAILYRNLYQNNLEKYRQINCALNLISEKKIIIFKKSVDNEKIQLNQSYILKTFNNTRKIVIFIDSSNSTILKKIRNYIFPNDIIAIFNNSVNDTFIKNITKYHNKKVIIF